MAPAPASVRQNPTMDSVEEEEAIVPSPMKKQKLNDEENDGGKDKSDPDSEWGVDSYDDDVYVSDPDVRSEFENEDAYKEYNQERRELLKGKGFVPDRFNAIHPMDMEDLQEATRYICVCIDKYNRETGKTVEYVSTVKGNLRKGAKFVYYMTIMAREVPGGPPVEYQVKTLVYAGIWEKPLPVLCRPTPKPEN